MDSMKSLETTVDSTLEFRTFPSVRLNPLRSKSMAECPHLSVKGSKDGHWWCDWCDSHLSLKQEVLLTIHIKMRKRGFLRI